MPESQEPKAEKPPFDPHSLLRKAEEAIKNRKDDDGGGGSWLSTAIIIVVVLGAVAAWSWISRGRREELARLRHEKFKAEVEEAQAEFDERLGHSMGRTRHLAVEIKEAKDKARIAADELAAEEARYEADLRAIHRIANWRDL